MTKPRKRASGSRATTRKKRRTKADIERIKCRIYETLEESWPMTVRQLFYQLTTMGVIDKTEGEYKRTVVRLTAQMRKDKELRFEWVADNTRWMRKPRTWSGLRQMLEHTQDTYRRAIWENQAADVEIWLEKDALSGVLYEVTERYDVPLMITRGYPSLSFLHSAAESIIYYAKPAYLYLLSDYDPSGVDLSRNVEKSLREMAPEAEIHFERIAVTPEQIEAWDLPSRPTKRTDSRAKQFKGRSVEVDSIHPDTLKAMVERCITSHIDDAARAAIERVEAAERETLDQMLGHLEE